jgi:hypothetical protein
MSRRNRVRAAAAGCVTVLLGTLLTGLACTGGAHRGRPAPGPAGPPAAESPIEAPHPDGPGSVAPELPAAARPAHGPAQAGPGLTGRALPTNQWWTSALTGPLSQPIWAHPLAVRVAADGLQISAAPPTVTPNAVVTPFVPAVTVPGPIRGLHVVGYGAFHVVLRADLAAGGTVDATLVQGSPVLYLRFQGAAPTLAHAPAGWDVLTGDGGRVAVARAPDGADPTAWAAAIAGSATDPVVSTTSTMAYDGSAGTVTQTLTAARASGRPGVWALLPHQRAGLVPGGTQPLAGGYPDALGALSVVRAVRVQVRVPMPGLVPGVPSMPLPGGAGTAVRADLDRDLADPPGTGGSYFGLKELGRLASIAEVAGAVGADAQRMAALDRLRPLLVDWLTYSGADDARYYGYDTTWGGLVAVPAEFGSNDYNDHHLQYGYLVRAAAVLGQRNPSFTREYGSVVDLVVRDLAGGAPGFPPYRVFNAYLGHSAASGFAPFADGNNQESSSEAVAAWEAVTRWGLVRHRPDFVDYGVTHYAVEAATARAYWLGDGLPRPAGYAHTVAGIVWDAKLDYATFFDPRPESVQGIQLLPLTFGSLYRASPSAATARYTELTRAVGGAPRVWGDLFAADLAVADPSAARTMLTASLPREESTSRALVRYWVELLAAYGPPRRDVTADGPYGLAFGRALVAVNPTDTARLVTFHRDGSVIATVTCPPGSSVIS